MVLLSLALLGATRYTLPDQPPHRNLERLVTRHVEHADVWARSARPAAHTVRAFDAARDFVRAWHAAGPPGADAAERGVVLDFGCGTGESTEALAAAFPRCAVLGIDRSAARLRKHAAFRAAPAAGGGGVGDDDDDDGGALMAAVSGPTRNALLLRADVPDFWTLADAARREGAERGAGADAPWAVRAQFILYPNPYPKARMLGARLPHGHAAFPAMLALGGTIVARSNWKAYLDELAAATRHAARAGSPAARAYAAGAGEAAPRPLTRERVAAGGGPLTAFERKYVDAGEALHEVSTARRASEGRGAESPLSYV